MISSLKNNLFLVWLSFEGRGETHQFVASDQNFLWYWRTEVLRSLVHSIWKAKAYPNIFHYIFKRILTSAHKSNYHLPWGRWAGGYIYQWLSLENFLYFEWFLMILDYFENSWNYHEFLETSNIILMHILLAFWGEHVIFGKQLKKIWIYKFRFSLKSRVLIQI